MSQTQPKRTAIPSNPKAAPKPTSVSTRPNKTNPTQHNSGRSLSPSAVPPVPIAPQQPSKILPPKPTRSVSATGKVKTQEPRDLHKENTASNQAQAKKTTHKPIISSSRPSSKQSQVSAALPTQRTQRTHPTTNATASSSPSPPPSSIPSAKSNSSQIQSSKTVSARTSPANPTRPTSPNSTKLSDLKRDFHLGSSMLVADEIKQMAQERKSSIDSTKIPVGPDVSKPVKEESNNPSNGRGHLWIRIPPDYDEEDLVNIKTTCSHSQDPLIGWQSAAEFIAEEDFITDDTDTGTETDFRITAESPAREVVEDEDEDEDENTHDSRNDDQYAIKNRNAEPGVQFLEDDQIIQEQILHSEHAKVSSATGYTNPYANPHQSQPDPIEKQFTDRGFHFDPTNMDGHFLIPTMEDGNLWDREHVWNQIPADLLEYLMEAEMGYGDPMQPMFIGDSMDQDSYDQDPSVRAARLLRFTGEFSASGLYQLKRKDGADPHRIPRDSRAKPSTNSQHERESRESK